MNLGRESTKGGRRGAASPVEKASPGPRGKGGPADRGGPAGNGTGKGKGKGNGGRPLGSTGALGAGSYRERPPLVHETASPEETERLGAALARELRPGDIIGLTGDLGAGKTCFVRGLAAGLGLKAHVKSPSFTLLNIYGSGALVLYHMDLYRLGTEDDFFEAGLEEYIYSGGISVIEWADKFSGLLERCALVVRFSYLGEDRRRISVEDRRPEGGRRADR